MSNPPRLSRRSRSVPVKAPHCLFVITTSDGAGPNSGTMSAQSGGTSPLEGATKSATGWREVSLENTTWTRKTGILLSLKAAANLAAFEMTVFASFGLASIDVIPFCRSITTRPVFRFSRVRSFKSASTPRYYHASSTFNAFSNCYGATHLPGLDSIASGTRVHDRSPRLFKYWLAVRVNVNRWPQS